MKNHFLPVIAILALWVLNVSCAKKENEDLSGAKQEVFDAWMTKYHPEALRMESGIYVDWIVQNPAGKKPQEGYWVMTDFTGRSMTGSIYASTDENIARQAGFYSATTHFAPRYYSYYHPAIEESYYPQYSYITLGEAEVLKTMREGERAIIYMPANKAYSYGGFSLNSYEEGFSSGATIDAYTAVNIDLKLTKVVEDPIAYDGELVKKYAADSLGITNPDDFTVPGLYMKVTEPGDEDLTITADTLVYVYYTGKYLDGFVFDTNIEEVARENNIYDSSKDYSELRLMPNDETEYVDGFIQAILHMHKGEKATVVFSSTLGYGITGAIVPYTPLVFELHVLDE